MDISNDQSPSLCRIAVEGEMTIYAAADLKRKFIMSIDSASNVEVDLSAVTDIDTTGIQILLVSKRYAEKQGKHLRFVANSAPVSELLTLYRLIGPLQTEDEFTIDQTIISKK